MADSCEPMSGGDTLSWTHPMKLLAEVAWMGLLVVAVLVTIGLPLAVVGAFRLALVAPSTLATAVLLRRVMSPPGAWLVHRGGTPTSRRAVWVLVGVVVVTGVGNLRWAGQHHATNRDPGVYLESGLWLGEHGTLLVDGRTGPFLQDESLRGGGSGFSEAADGTGRLTSQFPHATAVLIATADQIGGISLATRVGAFLTALAALLMWLVARRFVGDWWSTLAASIFSVNIVTIHFARDTFSEPLAAVLVLGLLAVILSSEKSAHWVFAGLLVGLTVAARIDSILVVLGVAMVVVMVSGSAPRRAFGLVAGASFGIALALVDLVNRSPDYLSDKWPVFSQALMVSVAIAVVAAIRPLAKRFVKAPELPPRVRGLADRAGSAGPAAVIGMVVSLVLLGLLVFRPSLQELHGGLNAHIQGLQQRDGLTLDGTRTYGESSLRWLTWYFGWPLVVLGSVGAGLLTRTVIARRTELSLMLVLVTAPVTLLYLQDPRISGDQIWALRRFLPVAIPLLTILAVLAASEITSMISERAAKPAATVLAASLIVPSLIVTIPLVDDQTLWWSTSSIRNLCDHLPEDSAVLVSSAVDFGDQLIRPLARECRVPTAKGDLASVDIDRLTGEWAAVGRRMVVLTSVYDAPTDLAGMETVGLLQRHLEQVVDRRPDSFEEGVLGVTISESVAAVVGR